MEQKNRLTHEEVNPPKELRSVNLTFTVLEGNKVNIDLKHSMEFKSGAKKFDNKEKYLEHRKEIERVDGTEGLIITDFTTHILASTREFMAFLMEKSESGRKENNNKDSKEKSEGRA